MKRKQWFSLPVLSGILVCTLGSCKLECRETSDAPIGEAIKDAVRDAKNSGAEKTEVKIKVQEKP